MNKYILSSLLSISFIISYSQNDPLVIAHRGATSLAPENTMASFILAIEMGVDFIELDVQESLDDSLMVIHDATVDGTTNQVGNVNSYTYAQLKAMDAGSHFSSAFAGEKIPSLFEVLSYAKGKAKICIELKASNIESKALNMIQILNLQSDVVIFSFDLNQLQTIKNLDPSIKICYLANPIDQADINSLQNIGGEYVASGGTPGLTNILYAQNKGIDFWMWTLNDTDDMQYRMSQGIDGIITDNPQDYLCLRTLFLNSGLVGHWSFNKGTGSSVKDETGNLNNGWRYNASWTTGKEGFGMDFNGSTDYVDLPLSNSLDISGDAVSISAWVNLDKLPSNINDSYGPIYDSDDDAYILYLDKGNFELRFKVKDDDGDAERPGIPESLLSINSWHHIAGVYNGHNAMIYLDGNLIDYHSNSDLDNLLTGQAPEIGRNNGNYFDGQLDEIKVYNRALTPLEVKSLSNQMYISCVDSSEVFILMDSINQSISNNIAFCDSTILNLNSNNIIQPTFEFDGLLNYINLNNIAAEIAHESHSFFAWIKTNNQVVDERLFSINSLTGGNVSLFGIYNGYIDIFNGTYYTGNSKVDDSQWHFVGYTWSETTQALNLWRDGIINATFNNVDLTSTHTDLISLGQEFDDWAASNKFNGQMRDITIWNTTLSSLEISDLKDNSVDSTHSQYSKLIGHFNTPSICENTIKDQSSFNNDGYSYIPINYDHLSISGLMYSKVEHVWKNSFGTILSDSISLNISLDSSALVIYEQSSNNVIYQDSFFVMIYNSPDLNLGLDTQICLGSTYVIPGGTNFSQYYWSDSSTGQYLTFNSNDHGLGSHTITLEVIDSNSCSDKDSIIISVDACTLIEEVSMNKLGLYPNPSYLNKKIHIISKEIIRTLEIYDISGRQVLHTDPNSNDYLLSIENLLIKGTYLFKIQTDKGLYTKKIVII